MFVKTPSIEVLNMGPHRPAPPASSARAPGISEEWQSFNLDTCTPFPTGFHPFPAADATIARWRTPS